MTKRQCGCMQKSSWSARNKVHAKEEWEEYANEKNKVKKEYKKKIIEMKRSIENKYNQE